VLLTVEIFDISLKVTLGRGYRLLTSESGYEVVKMAKMPIEPTDLGGFNGHS